MKITLIWFFIILAVVLVIGSVVLIFYHAPSQGSQVTPVTNNGTSTLQSESTLVPVYSMPTSTTIAIGTSKGSVTVNNFYKTALGAQEQFIVLAQAAGYEITYDTNTSGFYISVLQAPFDAVRVTAEANLLTVLGIGQTDACKLNASEGASGNAAQASTARKVPMSFCPGSATSTFVQ